MSWLTWLRRPVRQSSSLRDDSKESAHEIDDLEADRETELRERLLSDGLTGLGNRFKLKECLEQTIRDARTNGNEGALLLVDALMREMERLELENQLLSEGMIIDPSTGLPNRAAFDADQLQLHARRRRSEESYGVLIMELDDVEDFTDTFGVVAGRDAVRTVAGILKDTVRESDRAYRYGGLQFAALLPGADMWATVHAAERVRLRVESRAIEHPSSQTGILTVSIAVIEAGYRHPTAKDVLIEIENLLRVGKQSARNRTIWPR